MKVQLRITAKCILMSHGSAKPGDIVWDEESKAKEYIDQGVAEPVGVGPSETPEAGPSEVKEKKSSDGAQGGPLTDSAKSIQSPGPITSLSVSPLVPASRGGTASGTSLPSEPPANGAQSA
jgi:hypothetical protein